jgi:hypothetical protein
LGAGPGRNIFSRHHDEIQAIRLALREQHERILDLLLAGHLF